MARHHRYSKRSRESRRAMADDASDPPDYLDPDDAAAEDWHAGPDEPDLPPGPAG